MAAIQEPVTRGGPAGGARLAAVGSHVPAAPVSDSVLARAVCPVPGRALAAAGPAAWLAAACAARCPDAAEQPASAATASTAAASAAALRVTGTPRDDG